MFDVIPINGETWAICGGRHFADQEMFNGAMDDLVWQRGMPSKIVHGGARGADSMADAWAERYAVDCVRENADWQKHGRAAGPIRNQAIIDKHRPKMLVSFPGGKGTADMVKRARKAGIGVAEVKEKEPAQ